MSALSPRGWLLARCLGQAPPMADPRIALLARELHSLARLTSTEAAVATVRRAQARTADVATELAENASHARERAQAIGAALADLGVAPDFVGPALGKATAFFKSQLEQLQSPSGAFLGDLALENDLIERARFVRTLAGELGKPDLVALAQRLEAAHAATVTWIEARLAEVAAGAAPALRPTPPQLLVAAVQAAAFAPARALGSLVNLVGARVRPAAQVVAEKAGDVASTIGTTDADADADAEVIDLTDIEPPREHDLPIKEYHRLAGDVIMRHVAEMTDAQEVAEVLAFEQAGKARPGVVDALTGRLADLGVGT